MDRFIPRSPAGQVLAYSIIGCLASTFFWADPLGLDAFIISGLFGLVFGGLVYILVKAMERTPFGRAAAERRAARAAERRR